MCGIIFIDDRTEPVNKKLRLLYELQKNRGVEGFGFYGTAGDKEIFVKETKEHKIFEKMTEPMNMCLFHHRTPTSTENTQNTAHPFKIQYNRKTYYFIHNGVITNAKALFEEHMKQKRAYESLTKEDKDIVFNDSEALAWDFVLFLNKKQESLNARGSMAFLCLEVTKEEKKLYIFRNTSSPLHLYVKEGLTMFTSEGDNFPEVKQDTLYRYDFATSNILKIRKISDTTTIKKYYPITVEPTYRKTNDVTGFTPRYPYSSNYDDEEMDTPAPKTQSLIETRIARGQLTILKRKKELLEMKMQDMYDTPSPNGQDDESLDFTARLIESIEDEIEIVQTEFGIKDTEALQAV